MRPFSLLVGGRGAHGSAPASASLYGFAADCPARDREPLFTSARWGGERMDRSPGTLTVRVAHSHRPTKAIRMFGSESYV